MALVTGSRCPAHARTEKRTPGEPNRHIGGRSQLGSPILGFRALFPGAAAAKDPGETGSAAGSTLYQLHLGFSFLECANRAPGQGGRAPGRITQVWRVYNPHAFRYFCIAAAQRRLARPSMKQETRAEPRPLPAARTGQRSYAYR